jgi:hypothetical protein
MRFPTTLAALCYYIYTYKCIWTIKFDSAAQPGGEADTTSEHHASREKIKIKNNI